MKRIKEVLEKYNLKPFRYEIKGNVMVVDCLNGKYAIKAKNRQFNNEDIYNYLSSRAFDYYPKIISDDNDDYEITEYVEDVNMPDEQKMFDLINLVGLLHSKTTYYKEVDEADYKELYEHITNNIEYLYSYYNDVASIIESKIYMSPSEYLLIRNISKIYYALNFCKIEADNWYELIKNKRKQRFVVLHNNLDPEHFIKNKESYLISWNQAKYGLPVFDLYRFYKRHGLNVEFPELLKLYEKNYPLLKEERILLFILICLPDKIEFLGDEYDMCREISNKIDLMFKTEKLLLPYYSKETIN